ncbi:hypothetical protein BU24DRAFT_278548 [Aaosphaeria arxii CBS 175.79]|uniref:Uncharacterized protein n=1 Tax=Aaosphaeria arxii CBS 175.79 TaxID=1450172 RepID=A0A6A5XE59_9PLEO|nr:uncharacterized protein BU24DRAFT_278548 [Aaosphaeria arxii CBS 175.79]KAF2011318.1 hypothetical protein BU24DRAFT_278548 [Aaosphaeria arxii CBS 175.79]
MPPPSIPTGQSRTTDQATSNRPTHLFKISLVVLALCVCLRLTSIFLAQRKSNSIVHRSPREEKDAKKCLPPPEKEVFAKTTNFQYFDKEQTLRPVSWNQPIKEHPFPIGQNSFPPTFRPVYPWTGPPKPLPGPYDPSLFPLPTVRRHSSVDAVEESSTPDCNNTIDYSRRVSTNSIPAYQSTLHGSITRSSRGWRRNQWVVSGE